MEALLKDLRYGLQSLVRNPGFTAAILLTLALGIGINSAIFSVVNAVLIRPLPYQDPERLAVLTELDAAGAEDLVAPANFLDLRRQSTSFESLAGYRRLNLTVTGRGEPFFVPSLSVSEDLFELLGVEAQLGRMFSPANAGEDEREVVLSDGFWRDQFGADRGILGKTLRLDGQTFTVVGIAPADFLFFQEPKMYIRAPHGVPWISTLFEGDFATMRGLHYLEVIGRLKPAVSLGQAQAEMDTIARRLAADHPDENRGRGIRLIEVRERMFGKVQRILFLLFGAVGFVLLIACANVANLLLVRSVLREREIAIRTALGAARGRLFRQLVTESLLLAFLGGLLGLLVGNWGAQILVALNPAEVPRLNEVRLDVTMVTFTLLLSVLTGLFVGLVPASRASRANLQEPLREGGVKSSTGSSRRFLYNTFVVSEVAVTIVLLVCAGLLVKSFLILRDVNPGFDTERVLTVGITLPAAKYYQPERCIIFFQDLLERVKTLPGVEAAAATSHLPVNERPPSTTPFIPDGSSFTSVAEQPSAGFHTVTPGYFRTLGIPLLAGRDFTDQDSVESSNVLIINESLQKRFFPKGAVGKRIGFGGGEGREPEWLTVIGVVGDVRLAGLDQDPGPDIYASFRQSPSIFMSLVVRAEKGDPLQLATAVKRQVLAVDRDQPVDSVQTMDQMLWTSTRERRFVSSLLAGLAGVAVLLALVGVYGVMSSSVAQRTHEIGIRLALGAQRRQVLWMVVGEAAFLVLTGIALGVLAALGLSQTLSSFLFGIDALDLETFVILSVGFFGIALLATIVPARRAMAVDPALALQYG